jgi:hypothetical protein
VRADKAVVEVSGIDAATLEILRRAQWEAAQWHRLLSVYAEHGDLAGDDGLPPMLGEYRVGSNQLRFEPQFPLEPGVQYRAVLRPDQIPDNQSGGTERLWAIYELPARRLAPTTRVARVYPSAAVLPENLLKFYIHFTAPMSRGHIYDHIHMRDEKGKDVELPFLEIDEELWDPAMKRLTLFIDPGRIKRGVRPLEEVGPALETGKSYTLIIDREWQDGAGYRLKEGFQKKFKVGPPDRDPPDPASWTLRAPRAGTREPVALLFPEPMDDALARRVIRVTSVSGELVEGQSATEDEERRWVFAPGQAWVAGRYQLVVQTTVEDLAGNNIGKPFEVDLFQGVTPRLTNSSIKLGFEVR